MAKYLSDAGVVAATIPVLRAHGLVGFELDEVADSLGCPESLLHSEYGGAEGVLALTMRAASESLAESLTAPTVAVTTRELFHEYFSRLRDWGQHNPELYVLISSRGTSRLRPAEQTADAGARARATLLSRMRVATGSDLDEQEFMRKFYRMMIPVHGALVAEFTGPEFAPAILDAAFATALVGACEAFGDWEVATP